MSGSMLERTTLFGYLAVVAVFTGFAWPSIAHTVWARGGVFHAFRSENLAFGCGAIDFLGGGAVHVAGGANDIPGQ